MTEAKPVRPARAAWRGGQLYELEDVVVHAGGEYVVAWVTPTDEAWAASLTPLGDAPVAPRALTTALELVRRRTVDP